MTEQKKPPSFNLHAPSPAEIAKILAARRAKEAEEQKAKEAQLTKIYFHRTDHPAAAEVVTAGWLVVEPEPGAESVTLRRVMGPIKKEQRVRTDKGLDSDRHGPLIEFLRDRWQAGDEEVVINFLDPV